MYFPKNFHNYVIIADKGRKNVKNIFITAFYTKMT